MMSISLVDSNPSSARPLVPIIVALYTTSTVPIALFKYPLIRELNHIAQPVYISEIGRIDPLGYPGHSETISSPILYSTLSMVIGANIFGLVRYLLPILLPLLFILYSYLISKSLVGSGREAILASALLASMLYGGWGVNRSSFALTIFSLAVLCILKLFRGKELVNCYSLALIIGSSVTMEDPAHSVILIGSLLLFFFINVLIKFSISGLRSRLSGEVENFALCFSVIFISWMFARSSKTLPLAAKEVWEKIYMSFIGPTTERFPTLRSGYLEPFSTWYRIKGLLSLGILSLTLICLAHILLHKDAKKDFLADHSALFLFSLFITCIFTLATTSYGLPYILPTTIMLAYSITRIRRLRGRIYSPLLIATMALIAAFALTTPQYEFLITYVRGGLSRGEVAEFSWVGSYTPQDKLTVYTLVTGEMCAMSYAPKVFTHSGKTAISEFSPNPLNLTCKAFQALKYKEAIIISKHLLVMANKYKTNMPFPEFEKCIYEELNEQYNLVYNAGCFYYSIWYRR